jgi:DNA (cytosine-5)-methyltransferase 1
MMRHGSLFSGIGGFDLAAEWMGWENVFHCEWMEFPRKVLDYYWPNADSHIDICKTDFKKYANTIDILTGGFPCQPFSTAGKRKGTDDERYLWHEMLRAINEIKPKFVIAENVYGITNIDGGLVFEQVCLDLEACGYEVQPYIIPACAKNAPHRRDRVWFVAYRTSQGAWQQSSTDKGWQNRRFDNNGEIWTATNTNGKGLEQRRVSRKIRIEKSVSKTKGGEFGISATPICNGLEPNWQNFPTQSPICGGDDGLPTKLDGITFSKWRNESIKAYGNAIVPQVAYELFKCFNNF